MNRLINAAGGRKQFNGYVAALALTLAAVAMRASFVEYAGFLLATLGLTNGTVALEDVGRARARAKAAAAGQPGAADDVVDAEYEVLEEAAGPKPAGGA